MSGRLDGQVAVVTGAGRGIGRAYAMALAREGAGVVVNDLDREPADSVVNEIKQAGGKAAASYDSVSDFDAAGRIVQTGIAEFGRLDIMIANAGADRRAFVLDLTPEDWDFTLKTHLYGSINCSVQAAKVMRKRGGGAIVNITSGAFFMGTPGLAPYCVSKGAIYAFVRDLALELEPFGISVNAIAPGATRTGPMETYVASLRDADHAAEGRVQAMDASLQSPENVAPLAVFLASPEGRKVTGKVFTVQGDRIGVMSPPSVNPVAVSATGGWDVESVMSVLPRLVS